MASTMSITVDAYAAIEKEVSPASTTGRIYVPKSWVGRRVKVLLLEEADE